MRLTPLPLCLCGLVLLSVSAAAQDKVSEDELFGVPELVTQPAGVPAAEEDKKSLGVSGEAVSVLEDVVYSSRPAGAFNSYIVGNFLLDARLKRGVKAFANVETSYRSDTRETKSSLREAFIDFNLDHRVYFRTGKQVLQWGRCYLWNPTDLINVEKKPFVRKIGAREGAYGLKVHVPFGTKYNIYGFVDTGSAEQDRDLGGALKLELLAGRTEMSLSAWGKRDRNPVFGYDLSSRVGDVDIAGEVSVAARDNARYVRESGGAFETYRKQDERVLKAAVDLSRGFRVGNYNDRLTLTTEFFYNQSGYKKSPFADGTVRPFSGPLALLYPGGGTKGQFLLYNGLYEPNYTGRHYGAVFATLTRFLVQDLTLSANYVRNFGDRSGMVTTALSYRTLNDFSAGLLVNSFVGPRGGEYTFAGARDAVQLTFGVAF